MGIRPTASNERVASASISGTAFGHVERRYTRAEALAEIDQILATYRIEPDRRVIVLSDAMGLGLGDDWRAPVVRDLLAEAGADLDTAKAIRAEMRPGWR